MRRRSEESERVSILTRPEGRVLRAPRRASSCSPPSFNPHPTRRPGATHLRHRRRWRHLRFNPHPTRRPGATGHERGQQVLAHVSILTRPEGRVLPRCCIACGSRPCLVSILTRPEGRVLRSSTTPITSPRLFQSSPDPKAGCYRMEGAYNECNSSVSILTRPEGRVLHLRQDVAEDLRHVSILTRPEGRVLPGKGKGGHSMGVVSILTRPEGRVLPFKLANIPHSSQFQSSPDPKAGCYQAKYSVYCLRLCFNPHPTRRPGATSHCLVIHYQGHVSILTRPEGRVLHRACR